MRFKFGSTSINQDLEVSRLNNGRTSNLFIGKIDGVLNNLNLEMGYIDKTCEYWGWHMSTWTYFPYARDKKDRF